MITVGIRNLKDSLSHYINMVKNGEHIVITDHNKIVAEIVPAESLGRNSERLNAYLREQEDTGKLIPAVKKTILNGKRTNKKRINDSQINDTYEKTRSERI